MVSVITCTGDRPEAFALCERWMARQRGHFEWIVVDDGVTPTLTTMNQTVIRPEPRWTPGQNTQARNLLAGLEAAKGDKILLVEDDDYYSPGYIETMSRLLDSNALVGQVPARYYNVATRQFREMPARKHASLSQTGIRAELIDLIRSICKAADKFIDVLLWKSAEGRLTTEYDALGIKGMPGRPGIGVGHRPKDGWESDPACEMLHRLIGRDAEHYLAFAS